jgi:hypothetical protein
MYARNNIETKIALKKLYLPHCNPLSFWAFFGKILFLKFVNMKKTYYFCGKNWLWFCISLQVLLFFQHVPSCLKSLRTGSPDILFVFLNNVGLFAVKFMGTNIGHQNLYQPLLNPPGQALASGCFAQQSACHLRNLQTLEKHRRHAKQVRPYLHLRSISVLICWEGCV